MTWLNWLGVAVLVALPLPAGFLVGVVIDSTLALRDLRREPAETARVPDRNPGRYCPPVPSHN